jgi:hypothetical protein
MIAKIISRIHTASISKLYIRIFDQKRKYWRLYKLLSALRKSYISEKQRRIEAEKQSRGKYLQGWNEREELARREKLYKSKIFIGPKQTINNINQLHTR